MKKKRFLIQSFCRNSSSNLYSGKEVNQSSHAVNNEYKERKKINYDSNSVLTRYSTDGFSAVL